MTENRMSENTYRKPLPIGIDSFPKLRTRNAYYVDKSELIIDLMRKSNEVTLFTRPRRFGKTLNMSMLKSFFEVGCDKSLFDGLKVTENKEICEKHMGKYPVIFISLKSVDGLNFEAACNPLKNIIWNEARRFSFLSESDRLDCKDKAKYESLVELLPNGNSAMTISTIEESLYQLSMLLSKHYGTKTVILIDEYDVPLDKAHQSGFYREMVTLIRNLLGNALKTNDSLAFAVLTGCLRISKESIFTGLNNLAVKTITDKTPGAYFGFTEKEVAEMLAYYDMADQSDLVREWYDGYKFGGSYMYCPWDVINFCSDLNDAREADLNPDTDGKSAREFLLKPKNYWINTSGNSLIRSFIDMADGETRQALEKLVAGESVEKQINENLTYEELYNSIDNLWSVLFTTGYLTVDDYLPDGSLKLRIPNKEIRELYVSQIQVCFKEKTYSDKINIEEFSESIINGEAEKIEEKLNYYLRQTISIRDTAVNARKENFYHGFLMGLLRYNGNWNIKSNAEAGDGYADICVTDFYTHTGVLIEIKYVEFPADKKSRVEALSKACDLALNQIDEKNYEDYFFDEDVDNIIKIGIAFNKLRCKVKVIKN
jgi:hypothetical protein